MSESSGELTNKPFAAQLSNVYFSILALFCFKLFVKISLNLLAYFYVVRGNRKEAARISAEFYDYGQQHSKYSDGGGDIQDRSLTEVVPLGFLLPFSIMSSQVYVLIILRRVFFCVYQMTQWVFEPLLAVM